jgi:hypothetical protein
MPKIKMIIKSNCMSKCCVSEDSVSVQKCPHCCGSGSVKKINMEDYKSCEEEVEISRKSVQFPRV